MNPHDSVPAHLECDNGLKRPFSQNELHGKGRADWVRSSFYEGTVNTYPCQPSKGVPEPQRGWGMLVRLLGKLFVNPLNIPLRRFAFAAHRCPPSKRDVGLAKAIGAGMIFSPHRHPPAALRLRRGNSRSLCLTRFRGRVDFERRCNICDQKRLWIPHPRILPLTKGCFCVVGPRDHPDTKTRKHQQNAYSLFDASTRRVVGDGLFDGP